MAVESLASTSLSLVSFVVSVDLIGVYRGIFLVDCAVVYPVVQL